MAFQTTLNVDQAPGIAGDFCSVNPRSSALSVPGGYVAGAGGVTVGLFVWADSATGKVLLNSGTGAPTAFMHRDMQALVTAYPAQYGMTIPAGQGIGEMFKGGDFWAKNAGAGAVAIGMKAFANNTNGTVSFAVAGGAVTGATETKWFAQSAAAAGELVKITTVPLG